ncbi:MAG: RNA 3'-terminal phosphate cyclase [Candidatus Thorarchaeota archaeon]
MITIDGSYGEGGGQIIRTAVSLSALTMKPVRISKIRAGRSKPGLRNQHIAGIEVTGWLANASISGLEVGSTEIEFIPKERSGGEYSYDVGTAGSISLILQAVLPAAVLSPEPITLNLRGGTDVTWSPPVDYMREVFLPSLARLGLSVIITTKRRGHYPKGGGQVTCEIKPSSKIATMNQTEFGRLIGVQGVSHCVRLPSHVASRQADSAKSILDRSEINPVSISTESYPKGKDPHLGPGSGIVLWAESDNGMRIGADQLGKRGKRAEEVGADAAQQLVRELATKYAVDSHLGDMLVPYLAMAKGESEIGLTEVTSHLQTNLWVTKRILGVEMNLEGNLGQTGVLTVKGTELSLG